MNTALVLIMSGWIGQFPVYEFCPPVQVICQPVETIPPAPKVDWRFHMRESDVRTSTKVDIRTPDGIVYEDVWVLNGYLPQITTEKDQWGRPKVRHFWYGAKRKYDGRSKIVNYHHARKGDIVRKYPTPDRIQERPSAPARDTSSRKRPPTPRRESRPKQQEVPPVPEPAPALIIPENAPMPTQDEDDSHLFRDLDE